MLEGAVLAREVVEPAAECVELGREDCDCEGYGCRDDMAVLVGVGAEGRDSTKEAGTRPVCGPARTFIQPEPSDGICVSE